MMKNTRRSKFVHEALLLPLLMLGIFGLMAGIVNVVARISRIQLP